MPLMQPTIPMDRRTFLNTATLSSAALIAACLDTSREVLPIPVVTGGTLNARPITPTGTVTAGALQPLGLAAPRDAQLYVPSTYVPSQPLPLIVLFHGAGGSSSEWFPSWQLRAESAKYILLAIDSRQATWDLVLGTYGSDVAFVDSALAATFARVAVNPLRVAVAGFSDGATYALGIGLTNGDLFDHVISFSAGFLDGVDRHGNPKVFMSHGRGDELIDIDSSSRNIVIQLRGNGYDVEYWEFFGGHEMPAGIVDKAFEWLALPWT